MSLPRNVYKETKDFSSFVDAADYVKSVYEKTKAENQIRTGEINCQFRGRLFKGIKVDQEIKFLFDHDGDQKFSKAVPASTLNFLKLFGNGTGGVFEVNGTLMEIYNVKLSSSTFTKSQMEEFAELLKSRGLDVGITYRSGDTANNYSSDDDLIPNGLLHYFQKDDHNNVTEAKSRMSP
jgi:hypothetical protein